MNTFDHAGNHEHHAAHAHDHPSILPRRSAESRELKGDQGRERRDARGCQHGRKCSSQHPPRQ